MSTVRLKRAAQVTAGQSPPSEAVSDLNDDLPFLQGNAEFGRWNPTPKLSCPSAPKRARPSDVLLSVRAPVGALNIADQPYGIGRGLCALRARESTDGRFLWWALHEAVQSLRASGVGSTYDAVTADVVGALRIHIYEFHVQREIADFLDTETARIDALIAKKRRLVELAVERRWLFFADQVREASGPLVPMRRAISSITDGPFGSAFSSSEYTDTGVGVIRLGNIGFAEWRGGDLAHLPDDRFDEFRRHRVQEGDLLIAGLGDERNHAGRACVAPDLGRGIVKGKCFCASVDLARAVPDYLAMFCSSPSGREAVALEARGSTRSMINLDIVKSMVLPLPPVDSQRQLVERVRQEWGKLDLATGALDRQIALLQEHRQALITAAVTGELEVPGAA